MENFGKDIELKIDGNTLWRFNTMTGFEGSGTGSGTGSISSQDFSFARDYNELKSEPITQFQIIGDNYFSPDYIVVDGSKYNYYVKINSDNETYNWNPTRTTV